MAAKKKRSLHPTVRLQLESALLEALRRHTASRATGGRKKKVAASRKKKPVARKRKTARRKKRA